MKTVTNKLRVVHIPQIPMKGFEVDVKNEREAYLIEQTLTNQHIFLLEENVIPDFSNVVCVEMWDEDSDGEGTPGWIDYWNEEESMEWYELIDCYKEVLEGNVTEETEQTHIKLTGAEIQSKSTRQDRAESLIEQLPKDHDGRCSWLLNYGKGEEWQVARSLRGLKWVKETDSCQTTSHGI